MSVTVTGLTELTEWVYYLRSQVKGGDKGDISNALDYSRYVQSRDDQAQVHQGRWITIEQAAEEEEARIEQEFAGWLQRMVSGGGDISDPTKKSLALLLKRLQEYPPPPPASTYRRTGNLRASWQETTFI